MEKTLRLDTPYANQTNACLLFVRLNRATNDIKTFYKLVEPIIHRYQGHIYELKPNGLTIIFAKPYIGKPAGRFIFADWCAKHIILVTRDTPFACAIAFHAGVLSYKPKVSTKGRLYELIGKAMLELRQMGVMLHPNCVCYFGKSWVDIYIDDFKWLVTPDIDPRTGNWLTYETRIPGYLNCEYEKLYQLEYVMGFGDESETYPL